MCVAAMINHVLSFSAVRINYKIFLTRGFNKGQTLGKLTSCEDDLPGWFDHG